MELREIAVNYKHQGLNCAQAVLLALKDYTNLSEEEIIKITSGFGAGMGCFEATCGALVGANMALGLNRDGSGVSREAKILLNDFKSNAKATICGDLKGIKTGNVLTSCDDCVRYAVDAVLKLIEA